MFSVAHTLIYSKPSTAVFVHLCLSVPACQLQAKLATFYGSDRALSGRINEIILVTQFEFLEAGRILQKCTAESLSRGVL